MKASVAWLNSLLDPGGLSPEQVEGILTDAGFPIDGREEAGGGDVRLEVEVTSNRGDALSHVGLAREIAACASQRLVLPAVGSPATSGGVGGVLALENTVPRECPRFTAQVIRGVKVGPSPSWLQRDLEAAGQRPINNLVDVTNWLNLGFGHPAHVFDLKQLGGGKVVVRMARDGEALVTLDGKRRRLRADEVVVADAERPVSLAGVIGGAESEVTKSTTDVVLEVATWDPVAVRRAARRHGVRTDASHRFERYVDPREIPAAARRAAAMIAALSGGVPCEGMLDAGRKDAPLRKVSMRPERCRMLLGYEMDSAEMSRLLERLEIRAELSPKGLVCTIPAFRPDLEREVDLIEEVGRVAGLSRVPIAGRVSVAVSRPQESERGLREVGTVLTGLGFYEAVTFTFTSPARAGLFLPPGSCAAAVSDERRAHEPTLRPSILPSLLACRKANQDAGVTAPGGVRLYETAAVFIEGTGGPGSGPSRAVEHRNLAVLLDVPGGARAGFTERQEAARLIRGAVEAVVRALAGTESALTVEPGPSHCPAFDGAAYAKVVLGGEPLGYYGLLGGECLREFGLAGGAVGGELNLDRLLAGYPPRATVKPLPRFPAVERDLSLVVEEGVTWARVESLVAGAGLDLLEEVEFVGTYRGRQTGSGRKSVTLRLRFRDAGRTLRHEDADGQVRTLVELARQRLGAELRA
jgi:phenylalanyl-tRNA synthetase beta chain